MIESFTVPWHGIDLYFKVDYTYIRPVRAYADSPGSPGEYEFKKICYHGKDGWEDVSHTISDELTMAIEQTLAMGDSDEDYPINHPGH